MGDAGSTVAVQEGIWEAWAEDEYGEHKDDVGQAGEKVN